MRRRDDFSVGLSEGFMMGLLAVLVAVFFLPVAPLLNTAWIATAAAVFVIGLLWKILGEVRAIRAELEEQRRSRERVSP